MKSIRSRILAIIGGTLAAVMIVSSLVTYMTTSDLFGNTNKDFV